MSETPDRLTVGTERDIREFIAHYFATWSTGDVRGYGECFLPEAVIHFHRHPRLLRWELVDFLREQEQVIAAAPVPMVEVPLHSEVVILDSVAQVITRWRLTREGTSTEGTNFFTLADTGRGWRIVTLLFTYEA